MARGDNIATAVPSVGASETGGTSDVLTILTALVAIAESKVTPDEVNMDATLDFNSQAGENVKYFEFVTQSSAPGNETLYTKNVTRDELFYKDSSGSEVQITADGSLNVAATGSVTGAGYGSSGVAINWNSAGSNYQFKSGSGADDYASVTVNTVQLRDGSSHHLALATAAKSASETLTFPADVTPTNTNIMSVDSSGNVQIGGNTQVDSGDTLTVAGTLTASADVDLSGTYLTNHKHGEIVRMLPATFVGSSVSVGAAWSVTNPGGTGAHEWEVPLPVREGERIKEVQCYVATESLSSNATWGLYYYDGTVGSWNAVSGGTATISSTGLQTITLGTPEVVADFYCYAIRFDVPSATGTLSVTCCEYTTDKVA